MEKGQKFKGVATIWQDGKVDFRPQAVGEPQRKGISETKNGKLYESIGKNPKLIAHVSIDAKTPDKSAALHEELEKLLPAINLGVDIIKSFVLAGIDITMNQYNKLGKGK